MYDKLFKFVGNWLLLFKNIKFSVEKKDRKTKKILREKGHSIQFF